MKKITLLFLIIIVFETGFAQQTISFEGSEGYYNGDINGQNGWVVTGDGSGGFVVNQVVTSDGATDGTNSLKIANDNRFGWQSNGPIIGGFYNYSSPIPYQNAVISGDIYIDDVTGDSSDYRFGTVSTTAGYYTSIIQFVYTGEVAALVGDTFVDVTGFTWAVQTWYNIRIEIGTTNITYYIDDAVVATGALGPNQANNIEQVRFLHDNYTDTGFAYLDNFRTNDEPTAGVNEFLPNVFNHSYNTDTDVLTLKSSNLSFNNIEVYNLLGQSVMIRELSQTIEDVNLSSLQDGIYVANILIDGQFQTIKFLKQ
ncbi:T9SS type A sorting domain-containing protein [Subsaxibacter sp. CAU 1640]|uniref:T9SS type A sorting domain-containing protein n=1 Tax=Subsaxibacter sp. CAU 1640 TaxID=2933271 RepID=UPI002002D6BD|nr:T9SS type A sorting domain-containing protein [Subsaxibacter sp. CAU 1640]MCK7590311.1 T9SS type A sorting domain-containing protein [Subsaxibacter sp. CAU 1640]